MSRPTLAVIGSGISGLGAAWLLYRAFDLTLFEADTRVGGHSNTVAVDDGRTKVPVDTDAELYGVACDGQGALAQVFP